MFSSTYYEKLDPSYCTALLKLKDEITYEPVPPTYRRMLSKTSCELIDEFASIYLTPKILLQKIWKREIATASYSRPNMIYHFSFQEDVQKNLGHIIPRTKLMEKSYEAETNNLYHTEIKVEDLCFPHNLLEYYLHRYESSSNSHVPKKIIQQNFEMSKLYEKIKSSEGNEEEWICAMKEADDNEFVKQNIEYKLGEDLTNKKLWILYIKYLKEYDHQDLLQTYSKYCRFFVDDSAMKEEYKAAAEQYGKPVVPWKNAFDFEIYDESLSKYQHPKLNYTPPVYFPSPLNFNAQTPPVRQDFPFHANLMSYIVKNAKAREIQKLNFSCIYFYFKYRIPVCCGLYMDSALPLFIMTQNQIPSCEFKKESLIFHSNTLTEVDLNNIYISAKFSFRHYQIPLRAIIPKLHKCDAKFIDISHQELTLEELKFFFGHKNVSSLTLCRIKGIHENGNDVLLEDILAFTPKLINLRVFNISCSPTTAQNLLKLAFENKFLIFEVRHRTDLPLDPIALGEFINKNASPDCKVYIYGAGDEHSVFARRFIAIIDKYWKTDQKPYCDISGFD